MSGNSSSTRGHGSPRPDSAASIRSTTADERAHIEQLQSRVDALEYENDRLRSAPNTSDSDSDIQLRVSALQLERDEARSRISLYQAELKTAEASLDDRESRLQSLDRDHQQTLAALENEKHESEIRFKVLQLKLDDSTVLVKSLKEAVKVKERAELENDSSLKAKNAHIASLESRMEKAYAELEEERKELGGQVDELRQAGQVRSSCIHSYTSTY
jgi:CAP-Gly domain-containing linker protein 1